MDLITELRTKAAYDYIDGISRNHKPLQIWRKRNEDTRPSMRYQHVSHVFKSNIPLGLITSKALDVDFSKKIDYKFNVGLSVLENLLKSLGFGTIELDAVIKHGKTVSISFSETMVEEYEGGMISEYLDTSDLLHKNPEFVQDLNNDDLFILGGVISAKNFISDIQTDLAVDATIEAKIKELFNAKVGYSSTGQSSIRLSIPASISTPIAVQAYRLEFDKSKFSRCHLVSDDRIFF